MYENVLKKIILQVFLTSLNSDLTHLNFRLLNKPTYLTGITISVIFY